MAQITGTTGNDRLVGTAGADTMNGLGGNDTIVGGSGGADVVDGGTGFDTIEFGSAATSAVVVDFRNGTIFGPGTASISFTAIERVIGSNFNDSLTGNASGQNLSGQAGADTLWGAGGVDTLWGGGGAGDTFIFRETGIANADLIADFTSGVDKIQLDATVMTALGASGNFAAGDGRFWAAAGATGGHDADDRVIYDSTTRKIYYDPDGSGSAAAQLIATLQSGATFVATDIAVEGGSGGGGGQVINGTAGNDTLIGTTGDDTINGLGGNDIIDGQGGSDSLIGGAGNDSLHGGLDDGNPNDGGDALIGGDGNDTLDGDSSPMGARELDIDTLDGGLGDDLYYVDHGADVLVDAGGIDTIAAVNMSWTLGANFENLMLWGETEVSETGIGNDLANRISGGMGPRLEGRGGNDTLIGSGHDGTGVTPVLLGGAGNDLIQTFGGIGAILHGGTGNDTLQGGPDPAIFDGGMGNDVLTGGDPGKVFVFSVAPGVANADQITDFAAGFDTIRLDGNAHANSGTNGRFVAGDMRFYAAAGATGGHDADDRVVFNTTTKQLFYDADGSGSGTAQLIVTLQSSATLAATDIEIINGSGGGSGGQVINGTAGNDVLIGGAGADTLNGFEGNDTIDGGAAADSMAGGAGNDLYFVDNDGDIVVETQTGGIDEVRSSIAHYTMQQWVNNLTLVGGGVISGFGNEIDNVLTNASANGVQLDGYLGNDTLVGGSAGDELNGWEGDDSMVGGAGNDTMDGFNHPQDGVDTMDGGTGDDQYFVTTGDVLIDSAGNDTVFTGISWSLAEGFENLTMTGTGGLQMQGNSANNFVIGNSGNNYFNARAGTDTIQAGSGNDTIDMSSSGTGNHGNDVVDGGAGFDNIDYDGYATRGLIANWTTGTISGGDAVVSTVSFTSIEAIIGGAFADQMTGNAAGQNLTGKGGNDTLWGAGGADTLWGGTGADSFVFREMGTANADRIGDFASASDKISLDDSAFTAIGSAGNFAAGDGRFWAAAGATAGHDANDRVVYNTSTGSLYYDADGSGAGAAQLIATFSGNPALAPTDITVI